MEDQRMVHGNQEREDAWNRSLLSIGPGTFLVLLLPAVAMQFTLEVAWGPGDFLVAGLLLFGTGSLAVLVLRRVGGTGCRVALVLGIAFGLVMVWAELAVGLFD